MPTALFLTVHVNKFEHAQGAPVQRLGPRSWVQITFATPLAGGKYLSATTPDLTFVKPLESVIFTITVTSRHDGATKDIPYLG